MHAQLNQTPSLRQAAIRGPGLGGGLRRYRPALVYVLCPADQQRSAYYHHGRSSRPPPWVVLDEGKRMGGAAGGYVDCDGQHCAGGCRYQDSRQQRQEPPPPHGLTPQETNYPTPAQPDTADDQGQASVVHRGRAAFVGRLRDGDERQRDQGDRHVDPEDRPPGPLDQVPARDRADRGQAAGNAEEQGQSPAARVQVERHHHDGDRGRDMIAPPAPCTARTATSHASAAPPCGVRPHSADAPPDAFDNLQLRSRRRPALHHRRCNTRRTAQTPIPGA